MWEKRSCTDTICWSMEYVTIINSYMDRFGEEMIFTLTGLRIYDYTYEKEMTSRIFWWCRGSGESKTVSRPVLRPLSDTEEPDLQSGNRVWCIGVVSIIETVSFRRKSSRCDRSPVSWMAGCNHCGDAAFYHLIRPDFCLIVKSKATATHTMPGKTVGNLCFWQVKARADFCWPYNQIYGEKNGYEFEAEKDQVSIMQLMDMITCRKPDLMK